MFAQYSQLVRYSAEAGGAALRRFISLMPRIRVASFCGSLTNSAKLCRTNLGSAAVLVFSFNVPHMPGL